MREWLPELVIEVVSERSRDRDYTEKRDEYWTLGVKEYWIVDAKRKQIRVFRRGRVQWTEKTLGPADLRETKLLPGFQLPCQAVFEAAGRKRSEAFAPAVAGLCSYRQSGPIPPHRTKCVCVR